MPESSELKKRAAELANRPYMRILERDETTEGEEIYIAYHPELRGCIAQGETVEEAKENLEILRVEWIESLLEDGLDVPEPSPFKATSTRNSPIQFIEIPAEQADVSDQEPEKTLIPVDQKVVQ